MSEPKRAWIPPKSLAEAHGRRAEVDKQRTAIWVTIKNDREAHLPISPEKMAQLVPLDEESKRLSDWIFSHRATPPSS